MKTLIAYFIIIQTYPKDSLDNSFKYICKADNNLEYTVFLSTNKTVNDTIYLSKKR